MGSEINQSSNGRCVRYWWTQCQQHSEASLAFAQVLKTTTRQSYAATSYVSDCEKRVVRVGEQLSKFAE